MTLADYLENAVIGWMRGTTMPAAPATIYVALFTADPTDTGSYTNEVAAGVGYTRQVITLSAAPSPVSNTAIITFPTATGAGYGTVTHAAIVDNATRATGNMLASGALSASQAVAAGVSPSFAIGALVFTID
jgi:hypothetical protein